MTGSTSLTPKQQKHRHRARRLVMQCLYQHACDPKDITVLIDGMMEQGTLLFDRAYIQKFDSCVANWFLKSKKVYN